MSLISQTRGPVLKADQPSDTFASHAEEDLAKMWRQLCRSEGMARGLPRRSQSSESGRLGGFATAKARKANIAKANAINGAVSKERTREAILSEVRDKWESAAEIAKRAGFSAKTARPYLHDFCSMGLVQMAPKPGTATGIVWRRL